MAGARERRQTNQEMPPPRRRAGVGCKRYVYGREEHFAHKRCSLCISMEYQICDSEGREAEKGAMLAKINMLANSEGLFSATSMRRTPSQWAALG